MAATHGLGTYGNGVGTVTPEDHKLALAGLITKTTGNAVRAGLFWGGNADVVTGTAGMSYDVAAFSAASSRGATSGVVLLANNGVVNVTTTAAPGSNSRYDVVYVWQREFVLDGTDSEPVIGVAQGTAAASPTVPSLAAFPGAIELARILVPAGVTATNTGTTITQTAPFTAPAGGTVVFRTVAEMNLVTDLPESTPGWVLADDSGHSYNGTGWVQTGGAVYNARALRSSGALAFGVAYTDLSANANWDTTAPGGQVEGFAAYSNGWTIPATGVYTVSYGLSGTQGFLIGVTLNKSASVALADLKVPTSAALAQGRAACSASGQIYLTAGDVIRLFAISNSGTVTTDVSMGQFSIAWLRSA